MNIAHCVEEIVLRHGKNSHAGSLGARVIELLVRNPHTTPQGLAASLQQQTKLIRDEKVDSAAVAQIVDEIVTALELQTRLPVAARKSVGRKPSQRSALATLAARFPWPTQRPSMTHYEGHHFTQSGTLELLGQSIDELRPRLIVEVGAWLGGSTRWLLTRSPEALVSIDTWLGSVEHQAGSDWQKRQTHHAALLERLFETFLACCWEYRERLIALRTSSLDGFWQIASAGLCPELILLDGAHDELSVTNELELAHELFPTARLVIDDYNRRQRWLRGLVRAVDRFALSHGLTIVEAGEQACMLVD